MRWAKLDAQADEGTGPRQAGQQLDDTVKIRGLNREPEIQADGRKRQRSALILALSPFPSAFRTGQQSPAKS